MNDIDGWDAGYSVQGNVVIIDRRAGLVGKNMAITQLAGSAPYLVEHP